MKHLVVVAVALAVVGYGPVARADKVAVLPFTSQTGDMGATGDTGGVAVGSADADAFSAEAFDATRGAVMILQHTLPSASESTTMSVAIAGHPPETSAEYQVAGRAAGAEWTVAGRVTPRAPFYRVELEVCLVDSGRVESLARAIDHNTRTSARDEIAEMLALLLRKEGMGDGAPPWEHAPPTAPLPRVAPNHDAAPTPSYAPNADPIPRFALGGGLTAFTAVARASGARGSPAAGGLQAAAAYEVADAEGVARFSLRGDLTLGLVGPRSLAADVGGRLLFPLTSWSESSFFGLGPEATVGFFVPFGGDQTVRPRFSLAAPLAVRLADAWQVELAPELSYAPRGTVSLVFIGAVARALYRF